MTCNQAGLDLIKRFESCRLEAYQDIRGIWTIGWGHTGPEVTEGLVWTQDMADRFFEHDVSSVAGRLSLLVECPLSENQFSALVCFAFNIGVGAFAKSTLLKLINSGDFDGADDEFVKWDHCDGKIVEGLLTRREAERDLFCA